MIESNTYKRAGESRLNSPRSKPVPALKQRGFTLVEVMVALVIFGVIAASVLKTLHDSVRQQAALEERLAANWVAQQALEELRLRASWPPLGNKSQRITLADRDWEVTATVSAAGNEPRMRKIAIAVGLPDKPTVLTLNSWAVGP